jgi:hypothetical protein
MTSQERTVILGIALVVAFASGLAIAQEAPAPEGPPAELDKLSPEEAGSPDTETTYLDLRRSKDRTTRQWAERYFNLTKLQEWSSAQGKKVKAKYVSHADDLATVTLALAQGKEMAVPVAKLDKTSQSRVKQIAVTRKKLDQLIADGATGESDPAGATPAGDAGAPMVDEIGEQPRRAPPRRPTRRPVEERPVASPPAASTTEAPRTPGTPPAVDGGADPLGFGDLPQNVAPAPSNLQGPPIPGPLANPGASGSVGIQAKESNGKDLAKWRTDYEVFRNNFQVDSSTGVQQVSWGALKELREATNEVVKREADGTVDESDQGEIAKEFAGVGEFTWEATLAEADVSTGDWTQRLNLPPLPEPLTISFILDERSPGRFQNLKTGDRVRFVGHFIDFESGDIVAEIRFPDDPAASGSSVGRERPRGQK